MVAVAEVPAVPAARVGEVEEEVAVVFLVVQALHVDQVIVPELLEPQAAVL